MIKTALNCRQRERERDEQMKERLYLESQTEKAPFEQTGREDFKKERIE